MTGRPAPAVYRCYALGVSETHPEGATMTTRELANEITSDQADAVREAYTAAAESIHIATLDDLTEVRDKLDALDGLQDERAHLVRKALVAGARVVDIVNASGLSRPRIYQIRDGR